MLLEQKISRIAAEFADRIIGALTSAPIDELVALSSSPPVPRPAQPGRTTHPPRASGRTLKATVRPAPSASSPAEPSAEIMTAALAFFAERGSRGATAKQVGERLSELGLAAAAGVVDVVGVLEKSGRIRDAGFRRAAGKNATAPVYVAT